MRFIITVDTEEDNQWTKQPIVSTKNAEYIPKFQKMAEKFGLKPTYLVTYGMSRNEKLQNYLSRKVEEGLAEVGAHLHPWANPPYSELFYEESRDHPMPHELSPREFREKISMLVSSIKEGFGTTPISYRAGRWGFDETNVEALLESGIRVDSSVTPNISWRHLTGIPGGKGGMNYLHAPCKPYFLDRNDITREGSSQLLEVPVTVLFTRFPFKHSHLLRNYFRTHRETILIRALDRMGFGPHWLRPYPHYTSRTLIQVYRTVKELNLSVAVMMLHSSELMPGGSPYYPDRTSVERLYMKLRELFGYVERDGVKGMTLGEFAGECREILRRS